MQFREWLLLSELTDLKDRSVADFRWNRTEMDCDGMRHQFAKECEQEIEGTYGEDEAKNHELSIKRNDCLRAKLKACEDSGHNESGRGYYLKHVDFEGRRYTIVIRRIRGEAFDDEVPDCWSVDFLNPQGGFTTTGLNRGQYTLYANLLLAIKKLLETEKVSGLKVVPYTDEMSVIYDRFYRTFLSEEFLRASKYLLVRKSFFERIVNSRRTPEEKQQVIMQQKLAEKDQTDLAKSIKAQKAKLRDLRGWVGKPVMFNHGYVIDNGPATTGSGIGIISRLVGRDEALVLGTEHGDHDDPPRMFLTSVDHIQLLPPSQHPLLKSLMGHLARNNPEQAALSAPHVQVTA